MSVCRSCLRPAVAWTVSISAAAGTTQKDVFHQDRHWNSAKWREAYIPNILIICSYFCTVCINSVWVFKVRGHTVWLEIDVHETSVIVFVALSLKPVGTLALSLYRMWSVIITTVFTTGSMAATRLWSTLRDVCKWVFSSERPAQLPNDKLG